MGNVGHTKLCKPSRTIYEKSEHRGHGELQQIIPLKLFAKQY